MLVQAHFTAYSIPASSLWTSPVPLHLLSFSNSWQWAPFGTLAAKTRSNSEAPIERALLNKLLSGLDCLSAPADSAAFAPVLQLCSKLKALPEGKRVHAHIIRAGLQQDIYLSNCLVTMYGKCGNTEEARNVFDEMHHRDVVSWTTMIGAYAYGGRGEEAFLLFLHMLLKGTQSNYVTFVTVLNSCDGPTNLARGRTIHAQAVENGFLYHVIVRNALINMYGKCGSVEDARNIFDKMSKRNVISWNSMMGLYAQHGPATEVMHLFGQMQKEDLKPNKVTFVTVLSACSSSSILGEIHSSIVGNGLESCIIIGTALINAYGKQGSLDDGCNIFDRMDERDVISWNAIIAIHVQHMQGREGVKLFQRMEIVEPDRVTFLSVLSACSNLAEGKRVHVHIVGSGLEQDITMGNAIINMYGKLGNVMDARKMFDNMHQRDVFSWTSMIAVYAQHGLSKESILLFRSMQLQSLKPNEITFVSVLSACACIAALAVGREIHTQVTDYGSEPLLAVQNAVLNMYGKCGSVQDAKWVFDEMCDRDVVSWTAMIATFAQHGCHKESVQLFERMQLQGIKPNRITFVSVLSACSSPINLREGKRIHNQVVANRLASDTVVQNALLNMYNKCGSLEDALSVFDTMHERDLISWTSMMDTYTEHGHAKKALQLFKEMQVEGLKPNDVSFAGILSACSHAGLVDEGLCYFKSMSQDYGIAPTPVHYACMIDLFGSSGCLDDAEDFINKMPIQPGIVEWLALLNACRNYGDVERGECAAEKVLQLDLDCPAVYIILSDIYAAACRWDDLKMLRNVMKERGIEEPSRCSLIDIDNEVHEFATSDLAHPQKDEIYAELERLSTHMDAADYAPHVNPEHHSVDPERKDLIVCHHSQRLAISYGLIRTPSGTTLRLANNHKMCRACHDFSKFICKHAGREVIVRDSHCLHHFKKGLCSCRNYW